MLTSRIRHLNLPILSEGTAEEKFTPVVPGTLVGTPNFPGNEFSGIRLFYYFQNNSLEVNLKAINIFHVFGYNQNSEKKITLV